MLQAGPIDSLAKLSDTVAREPGNGFIFGAEAQTRKNCAEAPLHIMGPMMPGGINVVDTINELSDLSRKLNQKSDQINLIIESINQKLAALNFGVEVWLDHDLDRDPIIVGDTMDVDDDGNPMNSVCSITLLGFCKVSERIELNKQTKRPEKKAVWELALKHAERKERPDGFGDFSYELKNAKHPKRLLNASREERLAALEAIPRLLSKLKSEGERLLNVIEDAEKAADALTAGDPTATAKGLGLREFGRVRTGWAGPGEIYQYMVEGLPAGEEASIANMGSHNQPRWQILRIQNGVQGHWAGTHPSATHALAALEAEVGRRSLSLVAQEPDYRIEDDAHTITLLSERATRRGTGPRPATGARLAFKTVDDVVKFIAAGKAEGFVFEGEESLRK